MKLYHGGLSVVNEPKIMERVSYRPLDFGSGFYTTSSFEQAERWVYNRLEHFEEATRGYVSVYEFDEEGFLSSNLTRLEFTSNQVGPDWFRFVMRNRREHNPEHGFDLVTGPVANDRVYTVISVYEAGFIDEEAAIERMRPYRLANQYLFHTENALRFLSFLESVEVAR